MTLHLYRTRGFTLVEILMVISIIAVMAAILFPVFARAREQARATNCVTNLCNIALALRMYGADHAGLLPPREDDLGPLYPQYLDAEHVFSCPTQNASRFAMGAPADPAAVPPAEIPPGMGGPLMGPPAGMGAPPMGPGGPPMGPGSPPMGPGAPPMDPGVPPMAPGPGALRGPDPTGSQVVPAAYVPCQGAPPGGGPGVPADVLTTNYFYRAGRDLNLAPSAWVCSDHSPVHNEGANVLYTDGAVRRVPATAWYAAGFRAASDVYGAHLWTPQAEPLPAPGGGGWMP